jgi:hypothetical protein
MDFGQIEISSFGPAFCRLKETQANSSEISSQWKLACEILNC